MASTANHRRALIVDDEIIFALNLEADIIATALLQPWQQSLLTIIE